MKVIDLLNKIANGEISEDTLIEFDNGYKDYCSVRVFFDRYIMDRENLNCEVEIIEEDKKIENIKDLNTDYYEKCKTYDCLQNEEIVLDILTLKHKINEIIDKVNKGEIDVRTTNKTIL